jgi:ABC-type branched-subunit amino acid transport system permease subunit
MVSLLWSGAMVLTMAGALFFWGARVLEVESFYFDSSASLGLALVLVGLAHV